MREKKERIKQQTCHQISNSDQGNIIMKLLGWINKLCIYNIINISISGETKDMFLKESNTNVFEEKKINIRNKHKHYTKRRSWGDPGDLYHNVYKC